MSVGTEYLGEFVKSPQSEGDLLCYPERLEAWAVPAAQFPVARGESMTDLERRWRIFRAQIEPELPANPMETHLHHLSGRPPLEKE